MGRTVDREPEQKGIGAFLGYLGFRMLLACLRVLPLPWAARLAAALTRIGFQVVPGRLRMARQRLAERYGAEMAPQILRRNLAHYGYMLAELAYRETLIRERATRFRLQGIEHMQAAMDAGGVLVATAHISNWEVLGIGHTAQFGTGHIPVKRIHNSYIDNWIMDFRRRIGLEPVHEKGAGMGLVRVVRQGGVICFLMDQNTMDKDAVWVPLLGEMAATRVGPALLAIRGKATVIPMRMERVRPGYFVVHYAPAVPMPQDGTLQQRLYEGTRRLNAVIGDMIDAEPSQWLWLHRRWKRKPRPDVEPWRVGTFTEAEPCRD